MSSSRQYIYTTTNTVAKATVFLFLYNILLFLIKIRNYEYLCYN